ncbi:hypothetical protein DPMN_097255 [Dreissena polymorpha]|uniref:Uncharacterized protein n=1 Tax=Dreissena polymorpha TaxID=45954 RepID=A0A9D4LAT5_DREPO|nr:hypothetical protein DPMN_097255 [Dreissena polymorpha]
MRQVIHTDSQKTQSPHGKCDLDIQGRQVIHTDLQKTESPHGKCDLDFQGNETGDTHRLTENSVSAW